MVWFTLRSLCIQKVAELIVNEKVSTANLPKDLKTDLFYENIMSEIPTTVLREFFATKNLPRVYLTGKEASTIISNQIVFEDLEYLNISGITDEELLQIGQTLKGSTEAVPPTMCLITFIQSVMGQSSWNTLRELHFHNTHFDFIPLHTSLLALSFPNLTGFYFGEKNIEQYEFQNICRCFSQITRLSLPNTSMKSLDGISALSNLEYLELLLSHFENHDSIKDIFSCKKLKVLDISFKPESEDEDDEAVGRSPNFSSYMACNDVLPELVCLDISFNNITEQQLEALINSHKKLVVISLIGTPLQTRNQFESIRNVVLLTVSDLPNCIKSLQHYKGNRHLPQSLEILYVIGETLRDNYAEQSVEMLYKCFGALYARGAIIDRMDVHAEVLDCFYELFKEGRIAIFPSADISLLLIILKESFKPKWEENENHGLVDEIQTRIWSIFEIIHFSRSFPTYDKDICGYSVNLIKHADVKVNYPLRTAIRIMFDRCIPSMGNLNNTFFQFMFDNHFHDCLLHLLGSLNFAYEDYNDIFNHLFFILNSILTFPFLHCLDRQTIAVITFSQNLEQFDGNETIQKMIVEKILYYLTNYTFDWEFLFEESCFFVLTNMMTSRNTELREATIELLVTLFIFAKCPYQSKPWVKQTMGSLLKERINEISNAIMTFIPNEENHNMLTLYQWLISREPKRVRAWARWILEHFPGEEKERAKKRRLEEEENADFGISNFLLSQ